MSEFKFGKKASSVQYWSELMRLLRHFEKENTLPKEYIEEPGRILHVTLLAWGYDGRSGPYGTRKVGGGYISKIISKKIHAPYSFHQFFGQFSHDVRKYSRKNTPVPEVVARAFLEIFFEYVHSEDLEPATFVCDPPLDIPKVIDNIVTALYRSGDPIYCQGTFDAVHPRRDVTDVMRLLSSCCERDRELRIYLRDVGNLQMLIDKFGAEVFSQEFVAKWLSESHAKL